MTDLVALVLRMRELQRQWARLPYGDRKDAVLREAERLGQQVDKALSDYQQQQQGRLF